MLKRKLIMGTAVAIATLAAASFAHAAGSVSAAYTTMTSTNPDVGGPINGVTPGLVENTLGPNGLPVSTGSFLDVDQITGELQWWTPHGTDVIAGTTFAYPNPVTLPFDIQSNFFPDGTGGSNGGSVGFVSAILSGTFSTPSGGTVTFNLGSDDDAWVFLDGQLVVDNGGIHALAIAPTTSDPLSAGTHTVEVFFADRHITQSGLFFDANLTLNPTVPEASTWAMMLAGFGGLGFAAFRRTRSTTAIA